VESEGEQWDKKEIEDKIATMVFNGDKITVGKRSPVTFKLDPTKKPKWIDIHDGAPDSTPGIYLLEDGKLKLCVASGKKGGKPAERPTEFKTTPKALITLMILERAK
jgi:uncharacterized protein (TIGR03067 family)